MASLVLGGLGNSLFGPIGGLAGSFAGAFIDFTILGRPKQENNDQVGPRLDVVKVMSSTEGAPIFRCYGRMRIDTQMIWATRFKEVAHTTTQTDTQRGPGKGGVLGSQQTTTTTTTYSYFVSFALGLCEGPIVDIGAAWADGKPLDMSQFTWRLYKGDETQGADPKIEAVQGAGQVPGFRGLAYLVFEDLPLASFGNRIPQITIEVIRRLVPSLEDIVGGITIIPGLSEFAYATDTVYLNDGLGTASAQNRHGASGKTDFLVSLDQLESGLSQLATASLVVSWHGSDLRCGECLIKPKVEVSAKATTPWSWKAGGIDRAAADVVSSDAFGPLLGGAPADRSVVQAIADLKARGLRVVLYPFINLDIPAGNALPNPYSANAATNGQPVFPWRGRITCSPAPGYAGTVDQTAAAAVQVAAFFGTASAGDFGAWDGDTIPYSGPAEWSYRRFILHLAKLAVAAGGVDGFLIGSEMVALNAVRSDASTFPAVVAMAALAADVKAIVGSGCKVGYAANWSEFTNYRPSDGSNDLYFHLDPLWSAAAVDFVGIDNYMPLSDWRSGRLHLDAQAGVPSIYDQSYLQGNIEGGELYDWYYASASDRAAQVRTDVTDATYSEPWVFRYKDIRSWWLNDHYNRPGGVRAGSPTAWTPQSKPIWFTEFGCPAIDKGSNQPDVFYDPKSSESLFPYFSTGVRNDLIQRAFLGAQIDYWDPANGHNPVSSVYGGRMIDHDNMYVWTWDARPYPQFPTNRLLWRDGPNWRRGHWLNGRIGLVPLSLVIADICAGLGVAIDVSNVNGIVYGFKIDSLMSARSALSPLMQLYFVDACESAGTIRFVQRGADAVATYSLAQLVDTAGDGAADSYYALTRAQETDLPRTAHLKFLNPDNDYQVADVYARRLKGASDKTIEITPGIVLDSAIAQGICDILLIDAWIMREKGQLVLPPSAYALEPTDVIALDLNGRTLQMRLAEIGYQHSRPARLLRTDAAVYGASEGPDLTPPPRPTIEPGPAYLQIMDLPILSPVEVPGAPRLAAYADPWARVISYFSPTTTGFTFDQLLVNPAVIGQVLFDFYSGPTARWDSGNDLYVQVPPGTQLESIADILVLGGRNTAAVLNADGEWEILQFAAAELTGVNQYKLSRLLRGQLGSEYAMRNPVAAGATFVLLDSNVLQSSVSVSQRGNPVNWRWGPATKAIDDVTYQTAAITFKGIGLQPYAPVHLRGRRESTTADWTLTWVRRTRIDGDNWEQIEVPLGEEVELYDIEILDPGDPLTVLRSAQVDTQAFSYTSAMQVADFGVNQTTVLFRVYQISLGYGRGTPGQNQVYS